MPSTYLTRRAVLTCLVAGSGALSGCNAGVVEPRVRRPVDETTTISVGTHAAWRFSLDHERRGRLDLEAHTGDARCTTLAPAGYEAYTAGEPVPDSADHAFTAWLDDGRYRAISEIPAGEWVVLCENVGDVPAEVTVTVAVETWLVDLSETD